MTAEVVVRGELEIRKLIDGMNLNDALMMVDGILMQVCYVGNNLSKCMKVKRIVRAIEHTNGIFYRYLLCKNILSAHKKRDSSQYMTTCQSDHKTEIKL